MFPLNLCMVLKKSDTLHVHLWKMKGSDGGDCAQTVDAVVGEMKI